MASQDVEVNGVLYAPITQARYNELLEALQENRECRYLGVEEARVWCVAHKGTETLAEGLKACTPKELHDLAYSVLPSGWWNLTENIIYLAYKCLEEREKRRASELENTAVKTVMPEEVGEDGADDD